MAETKKPKDRKKTKPNKPEPKLSKWFFGHLFSLIRRHGNFAMGCILFGYCFQRAATALQAFAGHRSFADLKLGFGLYASVTFVFTVSITLSGLSIGLYLRERGNHRRTRERLTARVKELEIKIDPNRTSSNLTSEGLTRRDDQ
jgi:hypothetical protein